MKLIKCTSKKNVSNKNYDGKLLTSQSPFVISEAYRSLRTNLMYTGCTEKCPVYVITGSAVNVGKSLSCANLAISYAQIGKKTLIIDLDMRRPSQHKALGLENKEGVSSYLAGVSDEPNFMKTEYENLSAMVVGRTPPDPTELLNSSRFQMLLDKAKERFDVIFLDVPPVGVMSDASIIAKDATGYILVMEAGVSNTKELSNAISTIEKVNGNILGIVLNGVDPKMGSSRYDRYGKKNRYYAYYQDMIDHTDRGK